jgi:hypothetical protein
MIKNFLRVCSKWKLFLQLIWWTVK